MKKLLCFILVLTMVFVSCKTSKNAKKSGYVPLSEQTSSKNEQARSSDAASSDKTPIVMRSENFDIAQGEDLSKGNYAFYVIIGSFENIENARNFKHQLLEKGLVPVMLKSESGMYRIAVNQTNIEEEARSVISDIRTKYPEHKDIWLLKKK